MELYDVLKVGALRGGSGSGGGGFTPTQSQLDAMNSGITEERVEQITTNETNISLVQTQINGIANNIDYSTSIVEKRWYTGQTIGGAVTETLVNGTASIYINVDKNDIYKISCTGGQSGRAWYLLDADDKIIDMAGALSDLSNFEVTIPQNAKHFIVQSNNVSKLSVVKLSFEETTKKLIGKSEDNITEIQSNNKYRTSSSKFGNAALARLKTIDSGFVNIGFIGDSWTRGTEDSIVTGKYESYEKWLSQKLWNEYGFGGLGWLDFSRDGDNNKLFGCADLYEHWIYNFSGTVTGLDGSTDASAPNCLGVCCAHTVFSNSATLSLTFDSGYLDKFIIKYYKDAVFSVSINGGDAVTVTADSTGIWQGTEFGTTGTDITSVVITSLTDNCIIFGMDCFYGVKGVRCHKFGNRSLKLANYIRMNENQFETALSSFNLSWVSVLFAINDIGAQTSDEVCKQIISNYRTFINRIISAYTTDNLVTCDISLLGCMNIPNANIVGLPKLEGYEKEFAYDNNYGWCSTKECIGSSKPELVSTQLFSDGIHLNKAGSMIFGDYIYKCFFESISV